MGDHLSWPWACMGFHGQCPVRWSYASLALSTDLYSTSKSSKLIINLAVIILPAVYVVVATHTSVNARRRSTEAASYQSYIYISFKSPPRHVSGCYIEQYHSTILARIMSIVYSYLNHRAILYYALLSLDAGGALFSLLNRVIYMLSGLLLNKLSLARPRKRPDFFVTPSLSRCHTTLHPRSVPSYRMFRTVLFGHCGRHSHDQSFNIFFRVSVIHFIIMFS